MNDGKNTLPRVLGVLIVISFLLASPASAVEGTDEQILRCVETYQKEKGLSYEEAKRLCTANQNVVGTTEHLPDLVVQEIACSAGNRLSFNAANMYGPVPTGWSAFADVYFDGVRMGRIDLARPTGGDLTTGSAHYLTAFDLIRPVEVKIVVDAAYSVRELDEGNNVKVAKIVPCEDVPATAAKEDPIASCINKYQTSEGLSYEEARKRCTAADQLPQTGGCVEKYMEVFRISYDEAKKRCDREDAYAKPALVVMNRCGDTEKKLHMLIDRLNAAPEQDFDVLKKEIDSLKTELRTCEAKAPQVRKAVTPYLKNPCDEVNILRESREQLNRKISYLEEMIAEGEMEKGDLGPYLRESEYLTKRMENMEFACRQGKPLDESPCARLSKLEFIYKEISEKLDNTVEESLKIELQGKLHSLADEINALKEKCRAQKLQTEEVDTLYDAEMAYRAKQKIAFEGASGEELVAELQNIEAEKKKLLEEFARKMHDLDMRTTSIVKKLEIRGGSAYLDDIRTNSNKVKVGIKDKDIEIELNEAGMSIVDGETTAEGDLPLEYEDGTLISSNSGREIAVMPSELKETPELRKKDFMEIKVVDDGKKPLYLVKSKEKGRLIGIIPITVDIDYEVSAESGAVTATLPPWWGGLVSYSG